jgi:flagellar assembly protein FliH
MSSSTETGRVLRAAATAGAAGVPMPDLTHGSWTRWGGDSVRGDEVTEQLLDQLAETTRAAARAQGYATGWAEGRHQAETAVRREAERAEHDRTAREEQRRAEHEAALTALRSAAAALRSELVEVCRAVDDQAAGLALLLTRELVGRAEPDTGHVLARVSGVLPDQPVLRVRLHPTVAVLAGDLRDQGVAVVADPDLAPRDAVVESDDHVVDLRVDRALARLTEVLA